MKKREILFHLWSNRNDLKTKYFTGLPRMISQIFKGKYNPKNKFNFLLGILSILYVISPIDFIPEIAIGPIGLLDDLVILGFGIKKIISEISTFIDWEKTQNK